MEYTVKRFHMRYFQQLYDFDFLVHRFVAFWWGVGGGGGEWDGRGRGKWGATTKVKNLSI